MKPSLSQRNAKKKKTFLTATIISIWTLIVMENTKRKVMLIEVAHLSDEIERAL